MTEDWFDDPRMTAASFDGDASFDDDPATAAAQLLNSIVYRIAVALGEVKPNDTWEGNVPDLAGRFFARVARHEKQRAQVLDLAARHELPDPEGHRKDWSRIWPSEIRELLTDEETPR